ncbi:MAG: transposase [Campylobacterota bacterium]|nr:transposase [Campylobacterota bacterium]
MARRPRIDMPGFHHIMNRGVEQRKIFLDEEDFEVFLKLLCDACLLHNATLHSYCLMTNHYHLLVETKHENLSLLMRFINSQYASYFNRKLKRVGHLWQGRFKSWYITDESYLYTLIKYIQYNPIKAKMVNHLSDYPYSSYQFFTKRVSPLVCLSNSLMFKDFENIEDRISFFESGYDEDIIKTIAKSSHLVISSDVKPPLNSKLLVSLFKDATTKSQRDKNIKKAIKMGFSQHKVATFLKISQPTISNIMKRDH